MLKAGTTRKRDLTNKEFATMALLQAHITANGNYYDWGSNFTVYADGTSANNGEYKLSYNQSSTSKLDTNNLVKYTPGGSTFTLTGGSGTTANGSAVDLKGALTSAAAIDITSFPFQFISDSVTVLNVEKEASSDKEMTFTMGDIPGSPANGEYYSKFFFSYDPTYNNNGNNLITEAYHQSGSTGLDRQTSDLTQNSGSILVKTLRQDSSSANNFIQSRLHLFSSVSDTTGESYLRVQTGSAHNTPNIVSAVIVREDEALLSYTTTGVGTSSLSIGSSSIVIDDGINSKGLENAADYSANATERTLIDLGHMRSKAWLTGENFSLDAVVQVDTSTYSLRQGTTYVHNFINQNMTQMKSSTEGNATVRYLIEMNRNAGVGIKIADNLDNIGLRYEADYSANLDDLTVPNWGHVKATIGGVDIASGSLTPGVGQDGYVWAYNNTNQEFELVAQSGGGISNSAANNELMKSDGTDAVASGVFASTNGSIVLGSASLSGNRLISSVNTAGNSSITLQPEGSLLISINGASPFTFNSSQFLLPGASPVISASGALLVTSSGISTFGSGNATGIASSSDTIIKTGTVVDGTSGDILIGAGTPSGTGSRGNVILQNLPTSDPSVSGALWNDAGTIKISA